MSAAYTSYPQYAAQQTAPLPITQKQNHGYTQLYPYGHIAVSPPEAPESVAHSTAPSYTPSAASGTFTGTYSDSQSTDTGASIDLLEYMSDRLQSSYDPIPLDRSLVKQAQTSGELNAKTRELMELQALAQSRLAAVKFDFADGMKAAKEVQRDLQWTQKRVSAINQRAAAKYPAQFAMAQQRYPAPVDA